MGFLFQWVRRPEAEDTGLLIRSEKSPPRVRIPTDPPIILCEVLREHPPFGAE